MLKNESKRCFEITIGGDEYAHRYTRTLAVFEEFTLVRAEYTIEFMST